MRQAHHRCDVDREQIHLVRRRGLQNGSRGSESGREHDQADVQRAGLLLDDVDADSIPQIDRENGGLHAMKGGQFAGQRRQRVASASHQDDVQSLCGQLL